MVVCVRLECVDWRVVHPRRGCICKARGRTVNSVLMWIGGLLAAVLAALFAVPYFVDWNGYRGVFEEEVSRILGRDVRVGGKINVRLLPTPYLSFEKLRIADTRLGATEPLFRTESFTLWLSVPPLLQGNLEARHVALEQPVVTLAVDKSGAGNWTTLGIRPGTLPFVPQNVALKAVDINDGTLVLNHPRVGEVGRVTGVSGVVSAEALDGPYKFAGDVMLGGHAREVRVVTAKADLDGTIRFKVTAGPKGEAGAVYKLDGSLTGFSETPQIEGALSATLPLPVLPSAAVAEAPAAAKADGNGGDVYADLKGRLLANADQLEIKEVLASIENVGQPQLLTGGLTLDWGRLGQLDFSFASRWLDLDRLAGAAGRASPIETSAALIKGLTKLLPGRSATRGVVSIDQLTLGGAPLASLDLAVSREGAGNLRIERLFAELPAGARLALDGVLQEQGGDTEFEGQVTGAGPSLARLAEWGLAGRALAAAAPDGAFTLDARVTAGATRLALKEARAEFAGHALQGQVVLKRGGPLSVELNAETVESEWLWSGGVKRSAVLGWLDRVVAAAGGIRETKEAAAKDDAAVAITDAPGVTDFSFKLTTGVLRGPDRALRDVVVDIGMQGGALRINRLAFHSGDSLNVDFNGELIRNRSAPVGLLTGVIRAENAEAVERAWAMFEMPDTPRTRQLGALVPIRLAGEVSLGKRTPKALDVRADGSALLGRVTVRTNLDGGLAKDWRAAPAEITLAGEETATARLMDLLFARVAGARHGGGGARADVAIKAVGIPAQGMVTDAALSRDGLTLAYNGRTSIDASTVPSLAGTLEVAADRLGDVMGLIGVASAGSSNVAVTGTLGLSFEEDGRTKLNPSGLTIGGSQVSGTLNVARSDSGRLKVDGEIAVDQASLSGLMTGLVVSAPRPVPVSAADVAVQDVPSLWTDQPFAGDAFERFEGKVAVRLKYLTVMPGLALAKPHLGFSFAPGQVDVALSDGAMLGGQLRGSIVLAKAAAGARIKGELSADGITLGAVAKAVGSPLQTGGRAALALAFSGQALSPRSLVSAIRGSGRVSLADAFVAGLSPQIVSQIIADAFATDIEIEDATLQAEILKRLGTGRLDLGDRDVSLEVVGGALRVARLEVAGKSGRAEVISTVDLATMQGETEWRLVAASKADGKPPWPPVSIYYTGPLGALSTTEPRVALGSFERELTVRRMEYEVEELERLRKLDEERARQERERQKALEAERLHQQQLRRQHSVPLPLQPPGPRSELPDGFVPADASQAQRGPAAEAPAVVVKPFGESTATFEPAAANDAANAPGAADSTNGPTATSPWPASSVRRPLQRRPSSAGDTLMRSLNPGFP